jgi:hypothetical protein
VFRSQVVRWCTVLLAAAATAAGLLAATGPTAAAQRLAAPQVTCLRHGSVVFMQYYAWAKPPASNGCWTIIKPRVAPDNSSYVDCDMSGSSPSVTGAGPNWIYDDTNVNGHSGSSDQALNNAHCGGRTSWWGEYMAASGGFVERWSPTFLFEENYTGTHAWVPYTLSVNYTGSNPTVGPIPTIDTATASLSGHITAECQDAADYPSDYWLSIYNGTTVSSATVDTIDAALNSCYHS